MLPFHLWFNWYLQRVQRAFCLSFLVFVTVGVTACAQVPTWQTALVLNRTLVNATATDEQGNVYIVGSFSGALTLDSITLTPTNSRTKAVVAKWSTRTQRFVWAYQLGNPKDVVASAIAVRGREVYVAGGFYDTLRVGPARLVSAGRDDVYIAKLIDQGPHAHFTWAQRAGEWAWTG
ncbi:hypothetical protein [Hymenobacter volaticus]|uniref:PLD phosphodiesterase domain-containing protein n=1 Tax=Hymenobacter volaticus TaxID=2932254 RepID=A0ABY4GF56_9BACT|nr:hypothetical protein [Hymenobacter volaticus]UOQ69555.1 hypothetical protein MUN86_28355 [Hymenobacter volaticus]